MAGKVKVGSVIVSEVKGQKRISIGLGNKGKNEQYNLSVEVIVRDSTGKVVARQTDGFINLEDPRTQPDELLKAGLIDEARAEKMRQGVERLSDKIKYQLVMSRNS